MPKTNRETQADRLLRLLEACFPYDSGWVDAMVLTNISLSYTRRIHELRKRGCIIELDDKWKDGKRRTRYRLVRRSEAA